MIVNFVYTIIYFKNSQFYMISANCFERQSLAEQCARDFCELHAGEEDVWEYDIDKLQVRS